MTSRPNRQRALAREAAEAEIEAGIGVVPMGGKCGHKLTGKRGERGERCTSSAGQGTDHPGIGPCARHGGNSIYENARAGWLMGHSLAQHLNTTPWEALLGEVHRSAGELVFLDAKVASASCDADLEPGGSLHYWDVKREKQRLHLARVAKMALDAGVQERMVAQIELEGKLYAEAMVALAEKMLRSLGMYSDETMMSARSMIRNELMALDARVLEMNAGESEGGDDDDEHP